MTKFVKAKFETSGEYVRYEGKFVARFKHRGSPFTKAKFLKELIANHTVESYFSEMANDKAPLTILRDTNENWYYGILEAFSGRSFARV
jgi:hypothetical protein